MAAPNLIGATTINGKTTGANLTTTSATTVLNNPASSGKCLKVNTLNIANQGASAVLITVGWYSSANIGGTSYAVAGNLIVPSGSTLNIIDKTSQYYLEEDRSFGVTANTSGVINVTVSYEDIS